MDRIYYHWYDDPEQVRITINSSFVRDIVECEMAHCNAKNVVKFLTERGLGIVFHWIKQEQSTVNVGSLKRFCKAFNVDFKGLEESS